MNNCIKCNIELNDSNWYRCFQKKTSCYYICKTCYSKRKRSVPKTLVLDGKTCRVCGVELTNENYNINNLKRYSYICNGCGKKEHDEWKKDNPENVRKNQNNYYNKNSDEINRKAKITRDILKMEIFAYYSNGTMKCSCCGEDKIEFLTLDHINGGGNLHRKELKRNGNGIYGWLKKNNFPDGYRILCMNCNFSIGHFGYCPHKKKEEKS